jgi:hypothetical protein
MAHNSLQQDRDNASLFSEILRADASLARIFEMLEELDFDSKLAMCR